MKLFLTITILFSLGLRAETLTWQNVADQVKAKNYTALDAAQKLYRAKQNVLFKRGELLPKLNIWSLFKIPMILMQPAMAATLVRDVAPFLIPANWFNWSAAKSQYKAQKEQYRAVVANQISTARALFLAVNRDRDLLLLLERRLELFREAQALLSARRLLGGDGLLAYNRVTQKLLKLEEDKRRLSVLVFSEVKSLIHAIAGDIMNGLELGTIPTPNILDARPVDPVLIAHKAVKVAPELRQFFHLRKAAKKQKRASSFSVLGASSLPMGPSAYGNIPMQNGLGFGLVSSIKIGKSTLKSLDIRRDATRSVIQQQVVVASQERNSLKRAWLNSKTEQNLAEESLELIKLRLRMGLAVPAMELVNAANNVFSADLSELQARYGFVGFSERLKRLVLNAPYDLPPVELESLKEVQ